MKLLDTQHTACEKLAEIYGLKLLYLFGSVARGDTHAQSDVDVAYLAEHSLTLSQRFALRTALQDIFSSNTGLVDLVDITTAPPLLRYAIFQDGIQLAGSAESDEAFYLSTMKRYIDAKPLFQATQNYVHEQVGL